MSVYRSLPPPLPAPRKSRAMSNGAQKIGGIRPKGSERWTESANDCKDPKRRCKHYLSISVVGTNANVCFATDHLIGDAILSSLWKIPSGGTQKREGGGMVKNVALDPI